MHQSHRTMSGITALVALTFLLAVPSMAFALANLKATSVENPPAQALPRDSFVITTSVQNAGNTASIASTTRYFLVPITLGAPKNLSGGQNVPGLGAGGTFTTDVTVSIFSDTVPGTYKLLACADGGQTNFEGTAENDNCILSTGTIEVLDVPDLAVTTITGVPATIPVGGEFTLTATVVNTGDVGAAPSQVKYSLCTPAPAGGCLREADGGYKIDLKNKQNIPAIAAGGQFTNPHLVEVRAETLLGSFRIEACADSGKVVTEEDEDNCLVPNSLIQITPQPDLFVKSVDVQGAPLTINAGEPLVLTAEVKNRGALTAGASEIKFVFIDPNNPNASGKNLKDRAQVPALAPTDKFTVLAASIRTYDDTLPGTYMLQACIDAAKVVGETDESNNCTNAPSTLLVTVNGLPQSNADLVVPILTNPPTTGLPGDSFEITATIRNKGTGQAPATTTKFNLVNAAGTVRKNLKGVQPVPALGAEGISAVPTHVEIFDDTVPGTYFLEACADEQKLVRELKEDNNCRISTGQITVHDIPNLQVTAIDNPPALLLQGDSFGAKDTVQNTGNVTAPESTVKYYLVSILDQSRIDLKNTQTVPSLLAGQTFTETTVVRVRGVTAPGTYHLQACADSGKVVPEPSEDDNCLTSLGPVEIKGRPDLIVNRITVEGVPVTVARGASFEITSVVRNLGLAEAGGSTTKFYLVLTPGAAQKKALSGTQSVPVLAPDLRHRTRLAVNVEEDTVPGTYHVLACADEVNKSVPEADENNNCSTSAETINVVP